MEYNLEEHRHRFSAWAAARAAQRGYTTVDNLCEALKACGVREFLTSANLSTVDNEEKFRKKHEEWCGLIIKTLKGMKNRGVPKPTYGRAAKLVGMYIKSMIVLGGHSKSSFARYAHPPIDGRLLKNLAKAKDAKCPDKKSFKETKWTELKPKEYYKLVEQLHKCLSSGEPFWMLERFWNVSDER